MIILPIELNEEMIPVWIKTSTLKKLNDTVKEVHKRRIKDGHWGRSTLIREILEKNIDKHIRRLLKNGKES